MTMMLIVTVEAETKARMGDGEYEGDTENYPVVR